MLRRAARALGSVATMPESVGPDAQGRLCEGSASHQSSGMRWRSTSHAARLIEVNPLLSSGSRSFDWVRDAWVWEQEEWFVMRWVRAW